MYSDIEIGNTLRQLRLNKGYSLEYLCQDDLHRSFLSKVERGTSRISVDRFILLLERLHTNLDEFLFVLRDGEMTKLEKLIYTAELLVYQKDIEGLALLLKKLEKEEAPFSVRLFTISHICLLKKEKLTKKYAQELNDYLFSVDNWGIHEMKLFGTAVIAIDFQQLLAYGRMLIKKKSHFQKSHSLYVLYVHVFLNIINICIEDEEFSLVEYFIEELENFHTKEVLIGERIILSFNKNYVRWKKTTETEYLDECKFYINLMDKLGLKKKKAELEDMINDNVSHFE